MTENEAHAQAFENGRKVGDAMVMGMAELKPCPFCGGAAKMKVNASTLNCYAYCENCLVTMKRKFNGHRKLHDILVELMADEWNRRSGDGKD